MPNPVLAMDYANMYCGSGATDDKWSNHLTLMEVKLPSLEMQYNDHRAGGAPVYIEIPTGIARLECTFVLVGVTRQVMALVDSWVEQQRNFYVYGNVRDQMSGAAFQAGAMMRGQLGRADPQNFRKGDVLSTNYSIRGIIHYEFGLGGNLVYYWDFFQSQRYHNGVDMNKIINENLHINAANSDVLLPGFALGTAPA